MLRFARRQRCYNFLRGTRTITVRTPGPTPPEVAQLLATYAQHPPQPLTLGKLVSFSRPLTHESLLSCVQLAQAEIPRRLATRIQALESLPFIVGTNPHIARILEGFRDSFMLIATHPPVQNLRDNAVFAGKLEDLISSHADDIPLIAKGFQECVQHDYMSATAISDYVDAAIRNRIAVRLIAEQHVALTHALDSPPSSSTHVGIVDTELSPVKMINMCASFVGELCEGSLGGSPKVVVDGHTDARFAYVPVHMEYILTEVLKNAFRATVEKHLKQHGDSSAHSVPPVHITISLPPEMPLTPPTAKRPPRMLHIRIRDQGGGVAPSHMPHIFSYAFTTAGRASDGSLGEEDLEGPYAGQHVGGGAASVGGDLFSEIAGKGVQTGLGTIAGLGFGLPMSRLYTRYFGGSFELFSLDGWGCDVVLKLRCLDSAEDVQI
ncbi:unnamed protein product [Peniophora sp. CBMAI 1063]|nr:unnamed protein product [Peniophora sp. CBMAI 1063]